MLWHYTPKSCTDSSNLQSLRVWSQFQVVFALVYDFEFCVIAMVTKPEVFVNISTDYMVRLGL